MKLSVVIPLLNEEAHLAASLGVLRGALAFLEGDYELVLVDDGSTDGTWGVLVGAARDDARVRAIRLSRRFGKERALCAGLERARGDAVLVMDGDLQHPPELIAPMVAAWEQGYHVVEGKKTDRGDESGAYRLQALFFYSLLRRLSGIDLAGASDFKLLDRRVLDAWSGMPERAVFFRGMSAWLGFRRRELPFAVRPRAGGRTAWSAAGLARLAVNGVTSFSSLPVHVVTLMGLVFMAFAVVLGVISLRQKFLGIAVTGFTTVNLLLLIIGSMLMIGLGILGEYISKIYDEVKARPRYVIAETTDESAA